MATRAELLAQTKRILKDTVPRIVDADLEGVIQNEAIQHFSKHKAKKRIADLTASGSFDYELSVANFTYWINGFSWILSVEYPIDSQNPNIIEFEKWDIYEDTSAKFLRFLDTTPNTGTIRVVYFGPHNVPDSGESTLDDIDVGAFCFLVASMGAMTIAGFYGQSSDSNIGADAIAYRDKSDIWAARGKDWYKKYIEYMFPNNLQASMAFREFDTTYKELALSRLTHKDWTR